MLQIVQHNLYWNSRV